MRLTIAVVFFLTTLAAGDGKIVPPRDYEGSLEESAQEAIVVFHEGVQDLILKITVTGAAHDFAWVVPFPTQPEVAKADASLFKELFEYVQARRARMRRGKSEGAALGTERKSADVEVLERRIVGTYDVAIVRERTAGTLNGWLETNGYRTLKDAEDVLGFYRRKNYVFACLKVKDAALESGKPADLHPLRFTFKTGGKDAAYFPMKMTGLQSAPFDVNLYAFTRAWINDRLNKYGYAHRGFDLVHRDWDTPRCKPNGGKAYTDPANDPYLGPLAKRLPATTRLLQGIRPGARYYLTNIRGRFNPDDVRAWRDDLWLFPYYTDKSFVPFDARAGGCAAAAYAR